MSIRNKTKTTTVIAAFVLAAVFAVLVLTCIAPKIPKESVVKGFTDYTVEELEPCIETTYHIEYSRSSFDSIVFFVMGGDAKNLSVYLYKDGEKLLENVHITDNMCTIEGKSTAVKLTAGSNSGFEKGRYSIILVDFNPDQTVSVAVGKDGSLIVRLLASNTSGLFVLAVVCVLLFVFLALVTAVYLKDGFKSSVPVEKLFLATAIPLCAAVILMIPPWSTGDSEAHYQACYRLSNLFLDSSGDSEWLGRTDDVLFFKNTWWNATPPSTGGYEILKRNLQFFAKDSSLIDMTSTSEKMNYYSAFCYIPQTAAIILGRLIGFGPVVNCYLAKIMTAAFYIVLCYRSIKKAPFAKEIIALCAILPSSLMMSSAFSYDPMVIITTLNFISSVLLLRSDPENKKYLAFVSVWAFILGAVKGGGYLILLPLIFLIPKAKKGLKFFVKIIPLICGLLSVYIFDMLLPRDALFQLGSEGNGYMTASFALQNPVSYLGMTVRSYARFAGDMLSDLFGSKLCWGENTIPFAFTVIMLILLIIIASSVKATDVLKTKDVIVMLSVVFIALLTTPAMLLSWTPVGSSEILGIQGHYFFPVLPLIAMLLGKAIRLIGKKTGLAGKKAFKAIKTAPYPLVVIMMFFAFFFMLKLYTSR